MFGKLASLNIADCPSDVPSPQIICDSRAIPGGEGIRPHLSIRKNPGVLHQAKVAAVTQKRTLGQWLKEATAEKRGEARERSRQ
ncbi:hypothetical protein ACFLST_00085 [Chloroflexota bacterium]